MSKQTNAGFNTIAWLLVILGVFILRQVSKGRHLQDIPGDMGGLLTALIEGDTAGMTAVLARTGDSNTAPSANAPTGTAGATPTDPAVLTTGGSSTGLAVLAAMHTLAQAANNRYVWGGQGPNSYDCTGLVWAACKQVGIFTGPRFVCYNFPSDLAGKIAIVTTPAPGDVAVWPTHMGVVDGPGTMYSALNPTDGIQHSPLSYGPKGEAVVFYRFTTSPSVNSVSA